VIGFHKPKSRGSTESVGSRSIAMSKRAVSFSLSGTRTFAVRSRDSSSEVFLSDPPEQHSSQPLSPIVGLMPLAVL